MRILLVSPPIENIARFNPGGWDLEQADFGKFPPLGLLYLASNLRRREEHEVLLLDCVSEGIGYSELERRVREFKPDLAAVSTFTVVFLDCLLVARVIKRVAPSCHVVFGGPHATQFPMETLEHSEVDTLIRGEGEAAFSDLVEAISRGRPAEEARGVVTRETRDVRAGLPPAIMPDLDALKFPDRTILPRETYFNVVGFTRRALAAVITSRGCPMRCTFCATYKQDFRARSVANVIAELEELVSAGYTEVFFQDDTFNLRKERAKEICREMIRRRISLAWSFKGRASSMDEELMSLAAESGCFQIHVGVETGTQEGLEALKKGVTQEQLLETFQWARRHRIRTIADFMIGLPFERTEADVLRNTSFLEKLHPTYAQFNVFQPLPGTELFIEGEKKGLFTEQRWRDWIRSPQAGFEKDVWHEFFTRDELSRLLKKVYYRFYFRPSYVARSILDLRSMEDFRSKLAGLMALLRSKSSSGERVA